MAKKKKNKSKPNDSNNQSLLPRSPLKSPISSSASSSSLREPKQPHSKIVSVVHDVNGRKRGRDILEDNERLIYMHADDAVSMRLRNRDWVIAINVSHDGTTVQVLWDDCRISDKKRPRFAIIGRVNISSHNGGNQKMGSPGGKSKKPLAQGRVQLWPQGVSQRLWELSTKKEQQNNDLKSPAPATITNLPPMTPKGQTPSKSITTPSSAKSGFSFEGFVSSPTTGNRNSARKDTGSRKSKQDIQVAILPLKSNLDLVDSLVGPAETILLKLAPESIPKGQDSFDSMNVTAWSKCRKVLERMVLASCQGQYMCVGDPIVVSFQGKRVYFTIDTINENSQNMEEIPKLQQLTTSLDNLTLSNEKAIDSKSSPNADDIAKKILDQCESELGQTIPLSKITFETKVKFNFGEKEELSDKMQSHSIDSDQTRRKIESPFGSVVPGLESTIAQIKKVLLPSLTNPDLFPRSGPIRAPKGVLLYGPSGCGKTLLANQITQDLKIYESCQDGGSSNGLSIKTVDINCAEIQSASSILGDAERQLTRIFDHAEYAASNQEVSTLIVLDDVHLICPRRGTAGNSGGIDRVSSTLLALIDGAGQGERNRDLINKRIGNVAILAVTNNPSLLDPALRRAGRLDSEIEVPIPDDQARSEIFSHLFRSLQKSNVSVPDYNENDFMTLARKAKGFTGADCALCIKEATRNAIMRTRREEGRIQEMKQFLSHGVQLNDEDLRCALAVTKPSAIKSVTVEIPRVPWTAIGGMDSVKQQLREAIELPLTHAHIFESLKIPPPRGVLLYGPPGCSKTLMARALATEGHMNFLAVKGPELLSKWLGESERALASLFRRARLASPCIIFFDEIDAIASKRGSGDSSGGGERLLSQLLTELDGVSMPGGTTFSSKSQPRVVVVGATNRPDLLDNALTRPGRIDRKIYVGVPDLESRKGIFQIELRNKACDSELNVSASVPSIVIG